MSHLRVSHCGQTKQPMHSKWGGGGKVLRFNLNFHLMAKSMLPRCEQAEARSDELNLCHAVFAIKVIDWGTVTRPLFFFRISFCLARYSAELYFSYSFHGTFDLEPLSSQGFWECFFFSAPVPLLFCHHEGGFIMAAFGSLLQYSRHHLLLHFNCTRKADQGFYLII